MLAFYAYVVGAILLIAIVVTRGDRKALLTVGQRMAIPLAIIGIIVSAFWLTRTRPPPLGSVDGVYRNACCEQIELRNGNFITSRLKIPFKLRPMKYGLESQGLAVEANNGRIVMSPTPDCGSLLFADDKRSFTIASAPCGQRGNITFRRM